MEFYQGFDDFAASGVKFIGFRLRVLIRDVMQILEIRLLIRASVCCDVVWSLGLAMLLFAQLLHVFYRQKSVPPVPCKPMGSQKDPNSSVEKLPTKENRRFMSSTLNPKPYILNPKP